MYTFSNNNNDNNKNYCQSRIVQVDKTHIVVLKVDHLILCPNDI